MKVDTSVELDIAASPEAVYDRFTDPDFFPGVFTGNGPIPAINKIEMKGGGSLREGGVRLVHSADGSTVEEEIITLDRPRRHVYKLARGFKFPFNILVRHGGGDFQLQPAGDGTRARWDYYFQASSFLFYPIVALVVRVFFKGAMRKCMEGIKANLEGS